jgi:hypothetical protein
LNSVSHSPLQLIDACHATRSTRCGSTFATSTMYTRTALCSRTLFSMHLVVLTQPLCLTQAPLSFTPIPCCCAVAGEHCHVTCVTCSRVNTHRLYCISGTIYPRRHSRAVTLCVRGSSACLEQLNSSQWPLSINLVLHVGQPISVLRGVTSMLRFCFCFAIPQAAKHCAWP